MTIIDDRTSHRGYQQPNPANNASDDAVRLAAALALIDTDVDGLITAVAGKAAAVHGHPINQITGLTEALNGKAPSNHSHALGALSDVNTSGVAAGQFLKYIGAQWQPGGISISDVGSLSEALAAFEVAGNKGNANGYAGLDGSGKVPVAQLPSAALQAPAGALMIATGSVALPGTIKANGATLSRTAYADLWLWAQTSGNLAASEAAKTAGQYGPGNGTTTFSIPDLRGEFIRGWDDGKGIDSGRAIGSTQASQNLAHTHGVTESPHSHGVTQTPHSHGVNDPSHAHGVYDPSHAHAVYDPGHSHVTYVYGGFDDGTPLTEPGRSSGFADQPHSYGTSVSGTGIGIYPSGTGIGIYASGTGISLVAANANVSVNAATTGLSLQSAGGAEARPVNIAYLFCIKY
ncbi:tail fiber protein [Terrarubrum flagellatum]|uniref:tail fiber protein n=1 Tax=Terrirubrum flagellatum TaxID=2895980 RepID=UPI003144ED2F